MQSKTGWISDTTGFIGNGVEGIRTGGCSQTSGDLNETVGGLISNTTVGVEV